MKQQKSLQDVECALEKATLALNEIILRSTYDVSTELTFEQKVIDCVRNIDNGDPLRDFLDSHEIERAIKILADIYTVTGVQMPDSWY